MHRTDYQTDSHPNDSNQNPNKPVTPNGPSSGKPRTEYSYTSSSTDMDGNQLYYLFDWDDGTDSGWLGPFDSGEECQTSHSWNQRDEYNIRVKAKDIHGGESEWSQPLPVSMPKNRFFEKNYLFNLFYWSTDRFPILNLLVNSLGVEK